MRQRVKGAWVAGVLLVVLVGGPVRAGGPDQAPARYALLIPNVSLGVFPKAGVGTPYSDCEHVQAVGAAYYQDWEPQVPACDAAALPLAMICRYNGGNLPEVSDAAVCIELLNEPDLPQQGNTPVELAVELQYRAEMKWPGRCLMSAAVSQWDTTDYLRRVYEGFRARYGRAPAWQYLAVHCYFPNAAGCIGHVKKYIELAREWGIHQVAVTEWAILPCAATTLGVQGAGDMARARYEATKLRAWFDATPEVVLHLWFASEFHGWEPWAFQPQPACDTALVRDGRLTEWGRWYVGGP